MQPQLTKTQERVYSIIKRFGDNGASPKQVSQELNISSASIQSHLKILLDKQIIQKIGQHPNIYYIDNYVEGQDLSDKTTQNTEKIFNFISQNNRQFADFNQSELFSWLLEVESEFCSITPDGTYLSGIDAFEYWLQKKEGENSIQELPNYAKKFYDQRLEINQLKDELGLIDASSKFVELMGNKKDVFVDSLYYYDKFSVPIFGRTKTAILTFQAKMNGETKMSQSVLLEIKQILLEFIKINGVNCICYIPPSVKRKFQFMYYLEGLMDFELPKVTIVKDFKGGVIVQQKSLKEKSDRLINARNTFRVAGIDQSLVEANNLNLLLIDDFVGSGASLNTVAGKIKNIYPQIKNIFGFGVTGNLTKNFEVIKSI